MKTSTEINLIAKALVAARPEFPTVAKDATNPHFKSRYASLDAISEAVTPILSNVGVVALHSATLYDNGALTVLTRLLHESGQWIEGGVTMPLSKSDPQGAGSAVSYGRRYGLAALLGIVTEDDDDGNAASPRQTAAPAAKPAPAKPAATATNVAVQGRAATRTMPFGKHKGVKLTDLPVAELDRTLAWCRSDAEKAEKFADLIADVEAVIFALTPPPSAGYDDDGLPY